MPAPSGTGSPPCWRRLRRQLLERVKPTLLDRTEVLPPFLVRATIDRPPSDPLLKRFRDVEPREPADLLHASNRIRHEVRIANRDPVSGREGLELTLDLADVELEGKCGGQFRCSRSLLPSRRRWQSFVSV